MANNSKHIASIISSAFITNKCNDNAMSVAAVDFIINKVQKQHWEYVNIT